MAHIFSSLVQLNQNSLKYKPDKHIFWLQVLEGLSSAELASHSFWCSFVFAEGF